MKRIFLAATLFAATAFIASCNNSDDKTKNDDSKTTAAESKAEKNKKAALATVTGINNHNAAEVVKDGVADFVDYGDGSMAPVKGIDSCKAFINSFFTAFPDYKAENAMAFADDNTAVVIADWTGTFKGDMMGMKATGKSFKLKDVDIFTFNAEGKMTTHKSVYPMASLLQQVGAQMPK